MRWRHSTEFRFELAASDFAGQRSVAAAFDLFSQDDDARRHSIKRPGNNHRFSVMFQLGEAEAK